MMKRLCVIFSALLLSAAVSSPALAQKRNATALTPVAYYDSTGKLVGVASSFFSLSRDQAGTQTVRGIYNVALAQVGTDIIAIPMVADPSGVHGVYRMGPTFQPSFRYVSSDCSGTAYIAYQRESPSWFSAVTPAIGTTRPSAVLVPQPNGAIIAGLASPAAPNTETIAFSSLTYNGTDCYATGLFSTSLEFFAPVTTVVNLSSLWVPPFTAK